MIDTVYLIVTFTSEGDYSDIWYACTTEDAANKKLEELNADLRSTCCAAAGIIEISITP